MVGEINNCTIEYVDGKIIFGCGDDYENCRYRDAARTPVSECSFQSGEIHALCTNEKAIDNKCLSALTLLSNRIEERKEK